MEGLTDSVPWVISRPYFLLGIIVACVFIFIGVLGFIAKLWDSQTTWYGQHPDASCRYCEGQGIVWVHNGKGIEGYTCSCVMGES